VIYSRASRKPRQDGARLIGRLFVSRATREIRRRSRATFLRRAPYVFLRLTVQRGAGRRSRHVRKRLSRHSGGRKCTLGGREKMPGNYAPRKTKAVTRVAPSARLGSFPLPPPLPLWERHYREIIIDRGSRGGPVAGGSSGLRVARFPRIIRHVCGGSARLSKKERGSGGGGSIARRAD